MNQFAQWIGYTVMAGSGVVVVIYFYAKIAQAMWNHARAQGMMADFRKWYRGDAWYASRDGSSE